MIREKVLVTGAAGFIGPQVVKILLKENYDVIVVDKLTYAARVENGEPLSLKMVLDELVESGIELDGDRYSFVKSDICASHISDLLEASKVDYIINLAAESHVDRSIDGDPEFIRTEILGTHNMLEAIRKQNTNKKYRKKIKKAVFVSTDEVYGSIDRISNKEGREWYALSDKEIALLINEYKFTEKTTLAGGSPYASCKGGADLLVRAYFNTHKWTPDVNVESGLDVTKMPVVITRCANNFGPFQHPEKLIPLAISTLLKPDINGHKRCIPIYDKGLAVREWLHTEDHAKAIIEVMKNGKIGEVYNVGSGNRCRNRDLLISIFKACEKEANANGFSDLASASFDASTKGGIARPGHDLCYAVNCNKIKEELNWEPSHVADIDKEISELVNWYKQNRQWWEPLWVSAEFTEYWRRKYQNVQQNNSYFKFYDDIHAKRSLSSSLLI